LGSLKGGDMDSRKEAIRRIAFRIYEDRVRTRKQGDEKSDWYQAENEYLREYYHKEYGN